MKRPIRGMYLTPQSVGYV